MLKAMVKLQTGQRRGLHGLLSAAFTSAPIAARGGQRCSRCEAWFNGCFLPDMRTVSVQLAWLARMGGMAICTQGIDLYYFLSPGPLVKVQKLGALL